jgi:hypothetical protein
MLDGSSSVDTKKLLQEHLKREDVKVEAWKQNAQEYLRVSRKQMDRTASWESKSNRLPSVEEIYANRGWPSASEESELKRIFFENFKPIVLEKLQGDKTKLEGTIGVLYGIYFLNYITGGLLINKYFDYSSFTKWENAQWESHEENLNPNNLEDWPMSIDLEENRSMATFNNFFGLSIKIRVGAARYKSENPHEKKAVELGKRKEKVKKFGGLMSTEIDKPIYKFSMSEVDDAVLTGIEEAHHSLIKYFSHVHGIKAEGADLRSQAVIEVIDAVMARQSENDYLDYKIMYSASRFVEYAADLAQALYVAKYLPEAWTDGYKDYVAAIRKKRSELKQAKIQKKD